MIILKKNTSTKDDVENHLNVCALHFNPPLSQTVDISKYSIQIHTKTIKFEAWDNKKLIGLIACYINDNFNKRAFITNVSVDPLYLGKKISVKLLTKCIEAVQNLKYKEILLEVNKKSIKAIYIYTKFEFKKIGTNKDNIIMKKYIEMGNNRNYNEELKDTKDHKYAYSFDFDVIHNYMIKSFQPFIKIGKSLELGSFKGDFTRKLLPICNDLTCVEASSDAINDAENEFKGSVKFINGLFEEVDLDQKYDNIFLTHVLEHLSDPVKVLKKINDNWLTENGRLFLVVPNADAPSRQIAVNMGLISHNSAVTKAEKAHGHYITYTFDTLQKDVVDAGLDIKFRTGIFFKALANFQWDKLLQTDIISKEYLDGCFKLGQKYPELCSSIFFMCEKGNK